MLGRAAFCGVAAAGGQALVGDAPCPSAQGWLGRRYSLPVSLFIRQDGDGAELRLFDREGMPLDREEQRKLEGALLRGEGSRVPAVRIGEGETVCGVRSGYAGEAARLSRLSGEFPAPLPVRVERGEVNDVLALALTVLGCRVTREGRGLPAFSVDLGGFRLRAWDEEGEAISPDRLYVLLTKIEMERGAGRVALPAWAPAAADSVAARFGGQVLRLGRDRGAWELWKGSPWMWDGVYAACRVCAHLAFFGESLAHLDRALPRSAMVRREVPLRDRGTRILEALVAQYPGGYLEGQGARLPVGEGWISLTPFARRAALRVIAEAVDMETAAELCHDFEEKVLKLEENEEK